MPIAPSSTFKLSRASETLRRCAPPIACFASLLFLRAWVAHALRLPLLPSAWLILLVEAAAYTVAVEAVLHTAARVAPRLVGSRFRASARLVIVMAAAIQHSYFRLTGALLDWQVIRQAAAKTDDAGLIVWDAVQADFFVSIFGCLLAWAISVRVAKRDESGSRPGFVGRRWVPLLVLVGVTAAAVPPAPPPGNLLPSLPLSSWSSPTNPGDVEDIDAPIRPLPLYERPELQSPPIRRPNVVVVILESTRADVLGPWSDEAEGTPRLDEIASRSLVADDAYTSVTHTSKALVGILCGTYPRLKSEITEAIPGGLPLRCLPGLLREAGYRTAFMQTALGSFENRPGLIANMGFEHWRTEEDFRHRGFQRSSGLGLDEFAMLDEAVAWAESQEAPFLLTLLTVSTHHPYTTPGADRSLRATFEGYRRAIAHGDRFLGALYERMDLAEREDTILVVIGDHGQAFGEHIVLHHNTVPYEEGIRVPFLVHAPGLVEPGRASGLRHQVDVVPTVLDLLGAGWEGLLPGKSIRSEGHEAVFSSCWYERACGALRVGSLKYVHHYGRRPAELYDLAHDPREGRNLIYSFDPEQIRELRKRFLTIDASIRAFYEPYVVDDSEAPSRGAEPRPRITIWR